MGDVNYLPIHVAFIPFPLSKKRTSGIIKQSISVRQRRLFSLSNKNDELMENTLPQENVSGDTIRYTLPEESAFVAPVTQPRRRRSDKYKNAAIQQAEAQPEETLQSEPVKVDPPPAKEPFAMPEALQPLPEEQQLPEIQFTPPATEPLPLPAIEEEPVPQWTQRTPDDAELDYDYAPRPRTTVNPDFDGDDGDGTPPVWRKFVIMGVAAAAIIALALFLLLGPASPFKRNVSAGGDAAVNNKVTAEVLEFKAPSASGFTNTQIQLHMTTSTTVTAVKLVDSEGNDIPCTSESINAGDETMRIWTVGVLFSQPFEGDLYAAIKENDIWTTTDKKVALSITETTVATQSPTDEPVVTDAPTQEPTDEPTAEPTQEPTEAPVAVVTEAPTQDPTEEPTEEPTLAPTQVPVSIVMEEATVEPTEEPTQEPTEEPTPNPTNVPLSILNEESSGEVASDPAEVAAQTATEVPEVTEAPKPTNVPPSILNEESSGEVVSDPAEVAAQTATEVPEVTEAPTEVPAAEPTAEPTLAPTAAPLTASSVEGTEPDNVGLKETVFIGGESQKDYAREDAYTAPHPDNYAYNNKTGVYTFRGDNFRRNAAYGTVEVTDGAMDVLWSYELGSLRTNDSGTLYGVGWNNQPVIIKWTKEVREMMNLSEESKATTGLREVIFSAQDGNVYFLNLKTGEETRSPIKIGYPLRGSVSIDVLGQPMISFGQAISKLPNKTGNIGYHLYNLIDQSQLYFINGRSSSSQKQYSSNGAFDGTSLFLYNSGKSAMLVAGENGLFYTVDLNAEFTYPTAENPEAKTSLTVNPEITYLRHLASNQAENRTTIESAIAMYNQYAFTADGYGIIRCIDTTTMQSVWAIDAGDNTDAAIALDDADGSIALYTGNTAFNRLGSKKDVTIRRLDAMTGEEVWQYTIKCDFNKSEQSGVKASPLVGQKDLNGLVYFTVNMVDDGSKLLALDKESGELVWELGMDANSVSSPVAVYNEAGNGWVVQCDADGNVHLIDGLTGYVNSTTNLGGKIEASPAVYNDLLVIGTCSKENHMMYCLQIH